MRFKAKTNEGHTFLVLVPDDFCYDGVQVMDINTYNWLKVGTVSIERKWETSDYSKPEIHYAIINLLVTLNDEPLELIVYHDFIANLTDIKEVNPK